MIDNEHIVKSDIKCKSTTSGVPYYIRQNMREFNFKKFQGVYLNKNSHNCKAYNNITISVFTYHIISKYVFENFSLYNLKVRYFPL